MINVAVFVIVHDQRVNHFAARFYAYEFYNLSQS